MHQSRRRRYLAIAVAVTLIGTLGYALWVTRLPSFTISHETTRITTPVDAQGLIDYPKALNEKLSEGITPETNANVLIWKALGPRPEGGTMPDEYFRWLGIDPPPEKGDYFVGWEKYLEVHLKEPPAAQKDQFENPSSWKQACLDQLDKASKSPWKAADQPDIAKWLKQNEQPLALIAEATRREKFFNPLVSKSDPKEPRLIASLLPSIQKCRSVAQALKARAMLKISEGKYPEAWQDLMTCRRLGILLTQGATIIESLVGYAVTAIAIDGQKTLIASHPHSSQQIRTWLKELQALPAIDPIARKFDLSERYCMLDALQAIAVGGPQALDQIRHEKETPEIPFLTQLFPRGVDYNPAFQMMNEHCDRYAEIIRMTDRQARKKEIEALTLTAKKAQEEKGILAGLTVNRTAKGRHIGQTLLSLLMPALEKYIEATDRTEQYQQNLQVVLALAAYRADKGSYPSRLDDLAPTYLAQVPGDLFSGKPLLYKPSKEGYLLYSVGINEKDDGGQGYDDEPRGDDLRIRMP
jgi:hypothetical protein